MTFYEILLNLARGVTNWKCFYLREKTDRTSFFWKSSRHVLKTANSLWLLFFLLISYKCRTNFVLEKWIVSKNLSNPKTKALFQCCFSWFSEVNVVYFSWNIKRLIEKMMFSPSLTSPIVWPQWWSFADVSQQGLHFSEKISKRKIFFLIWLSQMFTWVVKKCLNLTFKVNFLCQKSFESLSV